MTWFYLSFADGERPKGEQFLGGAYIKSATEIAAVMRSHRLGVNPGGEVQIVGPIPEEDLAANVPEANRERLLTADELDPSPSQEEPKA